MNYSKEILNDWRTDGDTSASVIRIPNTGNANADYLLNNPLGREPVGIQIIMSNKSCNVFVKYKDSNKIVVQFTEANCDLNLRIW